MSPEGDNQAPPSNVEKRASLEEALSAELGEPAPVEHYHRPVTEHERAALQAELDAVEPAHAAAEARLHTLYAD